MSAYLRGVTLTALALGLLTVQLGAARAGGGALDPTFGTNGVVLTPTPKPPSTDFFGARLAAVALQADDKIVVGGGLHAAGSQTRTFAVARYQADGSLDPAFGAGGLVTTGFGADFEGIAGLAVQPDGKIVAAGGADGALALARYEPDGSLDSTFGAGPTPGTVVSGAIGAAYAVALQPDGKILVSAEAAIARLNADGSLDATFGASGVMRVPAGIQLESGLAPAQDGKILAAGIRMNGQADGDTSFVVLRLNADGSLDSGFGSGGVASAPVRNGEPQSAFALQPDGKILVAGLRQVGSQDAAVLLRFQPSGALDPSFGDQGTVTKLHVLPTSVLPQPDGKVVVVGGGAKEGFGLARYLPDGSVDSSFGTSGTVSTAFGTRIGSSSAAALQPDGKILAVGTTGPSSPGGRDFFTLARYLSGGSHSLSLTQDRGSSSGVITSQPFGIACDTNCRHDSAHFADQSLVTLTAHPLLGSAISWSGACAGSGRVCKVRIRQAARIVHVKFFRCLVPRLGGKRLADARKAIRRAHCSVGRTSAEQSGTVARGRVIAQHPAAGTNLAAGSKVSIVIGDGRQ